MAESKARDRREWRALGRLLPYLWPRGEPDRLRLRVVVAVLALIAAKLANVTVPIFYKHAVDTLAGPAGAAGEAGAAMTPGELAVGVPVALILGYGLARLLALSFGELRDGVFVRVARRAIRRIALQVFEHLHRLPLSFHLSRRTGALSRALERGMRAIEILLRFSLFNFVPTLVEIVLVAGILWALFDVGFALVTLGFVGAYLIFTFAVTEWRIKFRRAMNESDSTANDRAVDSLLNYETVKYFNNEDHEARRYDDSLADYEDTAVKSQVTLSLLNVGQAAIVAVGLAAVMLMAARGILAGEMTIGDFVLVNTYLLQLYQPLNFFGTVYREIKQALVDIESMMGLLDQTPEIRDVPGARPLAVSGGEVVFEGVRFAYDARRPILEDIGFTVAPGQTVALVGPTGAGKSTIPRLLHRFWDVQAGAVRIDGQDIREVTQDSLRAALGTVPQDTVLFNDTIYYNIEYGRPGAGRAAVERAARLAHIHDFIAGLPDGYDSRVGERGLKLSGGEKQRVAMARAILKDPAIFVFDEATSALDSRTERDIQANLDAISRGVTTVMIAHRLSTVTHADQILVLRAGRIVERGHHKQLIAAGGLYAAMWAEQEAGMA